MEENIEQPAKPEVLRKKRAKKILIFSLDYLPGDIGSPESAVAEITNRIDPSEIEFHMITMRYDSNVPRMQKLHNVTCHYVGLFSIPDATPEERRRFPLHFNKHYFQIAAGIKGFLLHYKNDYDGAWVIMPHYTGVPATIFNLLTGVPYALSLQESKSPEQIEKRMKPVWPLFKRSFTHATVVHSVSNFLGEWAIRMGYPGEVKIIPQGAGTAPVAPGADQSMVQTVDWEALTLSILSEVFEKLWE